MEPTSLLPDVLKAVVVNSLGIIACLTGCVLVIIRWRTLYAAATPALLGFLLALILAIGGPVVWTLVPRLMSGQSASEMAATLQVIGVVQSIAWAVAVGLLILGVVLGRPSVPSSQK